MANKQEKPGFTGGVMGNRLSSDLDTSTTHTAVPPESPFHMPRQAIHVRRHALRAKLQWWSCFTTLIARVFVIAVTIALSAYGIREMYGVLSTATITPPQWLFLVLFALNFCWISFAFAQALLGFFSGLIPRFWPPREHQGELPFKTAVLVPIYNEDPVRIVAAINSMRSGLERLAPDQFAFFILSDSNSAKEWIHEEAVFHDLLNSSRSKCPVYYRRRSENSERKAGNIADWIQRWGGAYGAMTILDADSIISPESLLTMSRRLAAAPGVGLIQTLPKLVRARSLYGRLQQFANHCYGPIYARGLAAWHGLSSNFWGHNAVIRTEAFAEACGLPLLPGKPPFGGHILSHDFIEAALLRRAGWGVRFDCDIIHSFEEAPPSLIDVLVRDRRWCQGNLQHIRLLFARGLTPATRIHLFSGILSYISAVLWLALIVTGLAIAVQASLTRPEYFAQPSLFPTWPVFDAKRALSLFFVAMAIIVAPKVFGVIQVLLRPRLCMGFGGPILLFCSALLEVVLSALYAPILMLSQSHVVWSILRGRDTGWNPQSRNGGALGWGTVFRAHWVHTVFGAILAGIAWLQSPILFLWLLPITGGLLLSIPLSWLSGGEQRGRLFHLCGMLRAPEEKRPCEILTLVQQKLDQLPESLSRQSPLLHLANNRTLCLWHLAQLPEFSEMDGRENYQAVAVTAQWKARYSENLEELEEWLLPDELMILLNIPEFVKSLPDNKIS